MLTAYQKLGFNKGCARVWIESPRLQQLGFEAGTFLDVQSRANHALHLVPVRHQTRNRVSFREMSGLACPIIDLNSRRLLSDFQGHTEIKLSASYKMLRVTPSVRSFHILQHRDRGLPLPAIEYFAGGGTLTSAITDDPRFKLAMPAADTSRRTRSMPV